MNLYQKIIEVRKIADGFKKDANGHNYQYVSGNQVLNKIKDKMNEMQLILQPSIIDGGFTEFHYQDKYGKSKIDFVTNGNMTYTWINAEKPEERELVNWYFYGQQDDISKSFGSALTYSERYFLLKMLGLPTDEDDPDSKDTSGKNKGATTTVEPKKDNKPTATENKPKTDSVTSPTATKAQVSEVFRLAKDEKESHPVFDLFALLDRLMEEGKISTKYTYKDKGKTVINWTVADCEAIESELGLPF